MVMSDAQKSNLRDGIRQAIEKLPNPVKMRARNAFEGFDKARQLLAVDREIASFRAITAEEEATSALFRSLQLRKYPGSERLSLYSHPHKAALAPFIAAVKMAIVGEDGSINIQLTLDIAKPEVVISVRFTEFGVVIPGRDDLSLQLVEPLGLLGVKEGISPANFYDRQFAKVADTVNVRHIMDFIKTEANARNRLLYASDTSLPTSKATEETIEFRQRRADTSLLLAIAALQVETHQAMAVQGIAAFLKMVGKALEEQTSPPSPEPI